MAVKNISDVTVNLSLSSLPNTGEAKIAILTSGKDADVHAKTYSNVDEVSDDFDASSNTYKMIQAAFNTDNFAGRVEVISAPNADVTSSNVDVKSTNGGADVSTPSINRYVYALMQHIEDGFNYVTTDQLSEKDLEAVSDYLYDNQACALIMQFGSITAMSTFADYSSKNQPRTTDKLNPCMGIVETGNHQVAVQLIARASQYNFDIGGIDLMKIGGLSEFVPDDDLGLEDIKAIQAKSGNAVVDKAGMHMMLNGYSFGANYLDNFVNTKIAKDEIQNSLQRALNDMKTRTYTQATIDFLYTVAKSALDRLADRNIIEDGATIDKIDMSKISNDDVEARLYKGFNIHAQISGSVEKLSLPVNLAE